MKESVFLTLLLASLLGHAQHTNVGIGTNNPQAPLDLGNLSGNRMIFWGEGSQTHYGIGSQNGNMQIYANLAVDNIGFGIGRSNAFGENLRIRGNGMVGIYNNNPAYRLDINGRLKLSGIDTIIYGFDPIVGSYATLYQKPNFIAFNNANNSAMVAKIGTSAYFEPVFFGATGHYFGIHSAANVPMLGMLERTEDNGRTTNGLVINGSFGEPGKILRSRGNNKGASWTRTMGEELHSGMVNAYGGNLSLTSQLQFISLEKVQFYEATETDPYDNAYELTTPSKLLIRIRVSANNLSAGCELCGPSVFDIVLANNGNIVRTFRYSLPQNTEDVHLNATALLDLPAGWHQLKLGGYMLSGPNVRLGSLIGAPLNSYTTDGLRMSVEVIPSFQ